MGVKAGRPSYWLHWTNGLVQHPTLSLAAKYRLGVAAALPNRNPTIRSLATAFPFEKGTFTATTAEFERHPELALVYRRPGTRTAVIPRGIAKPGLSGLRHYAMLPPQLVYAALDAAGSRRLASLCPLVLQPLLREQLERGAANIPAIVLALRLRLPRATVVTVLDKLREAQVIRRHPEHAADTADIPVYTVPLAESVYPPDLARLDPARTKRLERIEDVPMLVDEKERAAITARLLELRAAYAEEGLALLLAGFRKPPLVSGADVLDALRERVAEKRSGTLTPVEAEHIYSS